MNDPAAPDLAAQRAARLLRWYPKAWRSRYAEEFAELQQATRQARAGAI